MNIHKLNFLRLKYLNLSLVSDLAFGKIREIFKNKVFLEEGSRKRQWDFQNKI